MQNLELAAPARPSNGWASSTAKRVLESIASGLPRDSAIELEFGGELLRIGDGQTRFRVVVSSTRGASALGSLDEKRIGEAYLDGDISIEGDLVAALDLRTRLTDRHPLLYLWSTYGQRLLFGQVNRDKNWIREHYDAESDFYLLFLDKEHRCYSHGYFEDDEEPLHRAIRRKLQTAIEECRIQPGWRVLDIGA